MKVTKYSGGVDLEKPSRPLGISILVIVEVIGGVVMLIIGGVLLFGAKSVAFEMSLQGLVSGTISDLEFLFAFLGIILLVSGAISLVLSWGLWNGKGWARTIMLILAGLGIISSAALISLNPSLVGMNPVINIIVQAVIVYYLYRPQVKAYFRK